MIGEIIISGEPQSVEDITKLVSDNLRICDQFDVIKNNQLRRALFVEKPGGQGRAIVVGLNNGADFDNISEAIDAATSHDVIVIQESYYEQI